MKRLILEWAYRPKDFFEKDVIIENEQYRLKISDGKIILEFNKNDSQITHNDYSNLIESHFISRMIDNRIYYEIKKGAIILEDADGVREVRIEPQVINLAVSVSSKVSYILHDEVGNIITDSEQDEKKRQHEFLLKIQNVLDKDEIVYHIMNSYKNSIRFPNDELVYLYEIIDAIQKYFNGKSKALKALNIPNMEWSELGRICNTLPLEQGRHRGQMIGKLKSGKNEIERARNLSRKIIHSFVNYLDIAKVM